MARLTALAARGSGVLPKKRQKRPRVPNSSFRAQKSLPRGAWSLKPTVVKNFQFTGGSAPRAKSTHVSDRRLSKFHESRILSFFEKLQEVAIQAAPGALERARVAVTIVLEKLSENIAECFAHAAEAQHRADAATDPLAKQEAADMAGRWRRLAESYQFVERIERFMASCRDDRHGSQPKPAQPGEGGPDLKAGAPTDRASP